MYVDAWNQFQFLEASFLASVCKQVCEMLMSNVDAINCGYMKPVDSVCQWSKQVSVYSNAVDAWIPASVSRSDPNWFCVLILLPVSVDAQNQFLIRLQCASEDRIISALTLLAISSVVGPYTWELSWSRKSSGGLNLVTLGKCFSCWDFHTTLCIVFGPRFIFYRRKNNTINNDVVVIAYYLSPFYYHTIILKKVIYFQHSLI